MTIPDKESDAHQGLTALSDALQRSFAVLKGLMLVLLFAYLLSGIFIVRQHEKAVVLRFGRVVGLGDDRVLAPGLHWTWPKPFSEVLRIPAGRVASLSSSIFWTPVSDSSRDNPPPVLRPLVDGYTISGDANVLHSQWTVRFTIEDLEGYLFSQQRPEDLVERELNRAVLMTSASAPVDDLLRTDLEGFRTGVEHHLRSRLAAIPCGIRIQGVDVLNIMPPVQVAEAFDQVIRAEQEQSQQIADARAYAARVINEAEGQADLIIAEGETFMTRMVNALKADADYFRQMEPAVSRQPELMKQLLWRESLHQALSRVGQMYVVPADETGRREVRLQLSPRRQNPFAEGIP